MIPQYSKKYLFFFCHMSLIFKINATDSWYRLHYTMSIPILQSRIIHRNSIKTDYIKLIYIFPIITVI